MNEKKNQKSEARIEKFVTIAQKVGNQIYLRSLRDGLAPMMPLFILAGIAVLINSVFLDPSGFMNNVLSESTMVTWQGFGNLIINATLNVAAILFVISLSYQLSKNRGYTNPIGAAMAVLPAFFTFLPMLVTVTVDEKATQIGGMITYSNVGTSGVFAAILVGIIGTELFIKLTTVKRLRISLGENVPPAVANSFNVMLPAIITVSLFALLSFLIQLGGSDLMSLISHFIQEPLRAVGTSLPGYLLLVCLGNLLFSFGIHQSVIAGPILDPLLLLNMNDNMAAKAAGTEPPHIITNAFHQVFGSLNMASGSTVALIIAIFIFSKYQPYRNLAKLSLGPNLFNINEPIIFGLPIVFNLPMIIPFVLSPIIGTVIGYAATSLGLVSKTVVMIPWTTPTLISGYLATAGDWRAPVIQVLIIVILVFFYLPFLKISEKVAIANVEKA